MLGNTYNYAVEDVKKTINTNSKERFEFGIMITSYGTFILAFVVITIALNNILIGLSVNIAKEGIQNAMFHRLNAMARNLYGIENTIERLKRWFRKCCPSW